jgi:hypothetical protein
MVLGQYEQVGSRRIFLTLPVNGWEAQMLDVGFNLHAICSKPDSWLCMFWGVQPQASDVMILADNGMESLPC